MIARRLAAALATVVGLLAPVVVGEHDHGLGHRRGDAIGRGHDHGRNSPEGIALTPCTAPLAPIEPVAPAPAALTAAPRFTG